MKQNTPAPTTAQLLPACLTRESWHQALQDKEPLPVGLKGKLTLSMDDLIVNLDGSDRKVMNLGYASSSLSPDGTRIVHEITNGHGPSNGLFITDLVSDTTVPLPGTTIGDGNPLWSPDGARIAFTRGMDSGILGNPGPHSIVVTGVDGSNFQQITFGDEASRAMAWMPDSLDMIYTVEHLSGATVNMLNIQTGEIQQLFETNFPYSTVKVSPDGSRLVFEDMLPGDHYAIFVSNLHGGDRKLLVDGNPVLATSPLWSPDGEWVIVSVQTELPSASMVTLPTLIQVDSCKIIPLPYLSGYVGSWLP
jgi:Tol biopolymer transport system component